MQRVSEARSLASIIKLYSELDPISRISISEIRSSVCNYFFLAIKTIFAFIFMCFAFVNEAIRLIAKVFQLIDQL